MALPTCRDQQTTDDIYNYNNTDINNMGSTF